MKIAHAQKTHRGKVREKNEDALFSSVPGPAGYLKKGALFVVGDGLGGLARGEVASRTAVRWVRDFFAGPVFFPRGPEWLAAAFQGANRKIWLENAKRRADGPMATTLTASWFHAGRLCAAHVGDCRLYLVRNGQPRLLTTDHSLDRHTLSRALGLEPEVKTDLVESEVLAGDSFVQCSDGLYPLVPDAEIATVATASDPDAACRRFIALANERGGPDNITVQIIRFSN